MVILGSFVVHVREQGGYYSLLGSADVMITSTAILYNPCCCYAGWIDPVKTLHTEICSIMDVGDKSQDLQNNCVVHAVYAVSTTTNNY